MLGLYIIAILLFSVRALFMLYGSLKEKSITTNSLSDDYPFVSVIVPSRNEESNIANCLTSLMKSNYPSDKLEILAINDRSEDNTEKIIKEFELKYKQIKLINVNPESSKNNLKGKPGALQAGFEEAAGKYVLMTDADCTVHENWIKTIVTNHETYNFDLIPSFTLIKGNNFFSKMQQTEWIYMHTMASAGVGNNIPLGCYGNNLSIKKDVYENIGGYANIPFSVTEDLALEKTVFKTGGKIHYDCNLNSTVTTLPCDTFGEYIKQKKRWAVGGTGLGWKAVYFVISSFSIWVSIIASALLNHWGWFMSIILTRILLDYVLIETSVSKLKIKDLRIWILPSVIFFTFMELLVPFTLLTGKVKWKGQKF